MFFLERTERQRERVAALLRLSGSGQIKQDFACGMLGGLGFEVERNFSKSAVFRQLLLVFHQPAHEVFSGIEEACEVGSVGLLLQQGFQFIEGIGFVDDLILAGGVVEVAGILVVTFGQGEGVIDDVSFFEFLEATVEVSVQDLLIAVIVPGDVGIDAGGMIEPHDIPAVRLVTGVAFDRPCFIACGLQEKLIGGRISRTDCRSVDQGSVGGLIPVIDLYVCNAVYDGVMEVVGLLKEALCGHILEDLLNGLLQTLFRCRQLCTRNQVLGLYGGDGGAACVSGGIREALLEPEAFGMVQEEDLEGGFALLGCDAAVGIQLDGIGQVIGEEGICQEVIDICLVFVEMCASVAADLIDDIAVLAMDCQGVQAVIARFHVHPFPLLGVAPEADVGQRGAMVKAAHLNMS